MTSTTLPRSELTSDIAGWRDGSGPAVLLIHGVGLRAEAWVPMLPHLASQFSITLVDLPGHGQSARLPGRPTLADYTDRVAEVLETPTFVVGHSMGALIAMDMAVRYPALVSAITPLNAIFRRTDAASRAIKERSAALANEACPDPSGTLDRWFGSAPQGHMKAARDACHNWLTTVDPVGYAQAYRVFADEDGPSDASLAQIACPALFITGQEEPNSTPAMSQALAQHVPQGRAAIVAKARHMMPMTHATEVSDLLSMFIHESAGHFAEP